MIGQIVRAALLVCLGQSAMAQSALPFEVGGSFSLTDQNGAVRTEKDPEGRAQLLFFGYANCPGICSAALPMMGDLAEALLQEGLQVRPVMITVDPTRDRVETLAEQLSVFHEDFIGLTGTPEALSIAYDAYSVEHSLAYEDPVYGPVYTHGSFIYLLDSSGEVLTLIPPVLSAARAIEIALSYLR